MKEWLEAALPLKQQQREHGTGSGPFLPEQRSTFCSLLRAWHTAPHPDSSTSLCSISFPQ